jgi:choline-sulfatase
MAERPNVLVIMDDQHRFDWVGYAGSDFVRTPNIDGLAEDGCVFTHCCTTAPVCGPARIALATGLLPTRTGTTTNGTSFMPLSTPNHYCHFRDQGYRVELVGRHDLAKPGAPASIHGNRPLNFSYGFTRAFEVEGGMSCAQTVAVTGEPNGPYGWYLKQQGLLDAYVQDFVSRRDKGWIIGASHDSVLPLEHHQDEFVGRKAVERIEQQEDDYPFYMFVSFQSPHDPFDAPGELAEHYRDTDVPEPIPPAMEGKPARIQQRYRNMYSAATLDDVVLARRQYCGKVELIDRQVGKILDTMDRRGFLDNTIVVFASDHGEHLGDLGLFIKHTAYEPSLRVPLVVSGPGVEPGRTDALVELFDINPTLVEMAGLPPQTDLDARSFAPLLRGQTSAHRDACVTVEGSYRAVRTQTHKYIETANQQAELYDVQADPGETHNLIENEREVARRLARRLRDRFVEGRWRSE